MSKILELRERLEQLQEDARFTEAHESGEPWAVANTQERLALEDELRTLETSEAHGLANALAWFQSIKEMVDALRAEEAAQIQDDYGALECLQESVLSVEVRSGWYSPAGGNADSAPAEYRILLSTGGPACQLVGELDEHGEPESARLEHQDWGTQWGEVHLSILAEHVEGELTDIEAFNKASEYLLTFARQFYFGEG